MIWEHPQDGRFQFTLLPDIKVSSSYLSVEECTHHQRKAAQQRHVGEVKFVAWRFFQRWSRK